LVGQDIKGPPPLTTKQASSSSTDLWLKSRSSDLALAAPSPEPIQQTWQLQAALQQNCSSLFYAVKLYVSDNARVTACLARDLDSPRRREAATSQWGFRLIEVLSGVPDAALLLDVRGTRAVKFVLVICGLLSASAAQAQNAPWCLQSSALDGSLRCTYATFEQCLVDRQAKNGFCTQNSTYQASSPSIRRR
jgi:hypothetical protein